MKKWGSRNWLTPRRHQLSQASSGDGGAWGSRSRTVTWWPSSASNRAVPKPTTPAPRITMSATAAVTLGPLGGHGRGEQGQLGFAQLVEEAGVVEARHAHHLTQAEAFEGGVDALGGLHDRERDA